MTEAIEVNRVRTVQLSNIAHNLCSPLSVITSSLQLITDGTFGAVGEDVAEWGTKTLNAVRFVLQLTNDVLDLTKIE